MTFAGFTFARPRPSRLAGTLFAACLVWALGLQVGIYGPTLIGQSSGLVALLVGFTLITVGLRLTEHWKLFAVYVAAVAASVFIWRALFPLFF